MHSPPTTNLITRNDVMHVTVKSVSSPVRRVSLPLLAALALGRAAWAVDSDWTQWRGADGTGVSADTNLPTRWTATEGVRWKVDLPGRGLSSPIISAGKLFVTACTGVNQDRLHVLCYDASDGRKLWERQLWATGLTACHPKTCMAAPTPASDGSRVYALFATNDLVCFDHEGTLLWYRSLARDYPNITNQVGMAASPVLWRRTLILSLETDAEACALGIDTDTGKNKWRIERELGINWVTPHVTRRGTSAELLLQSRSDISAYDPETGQKRWSHRGGALDMIPTPLALGDAVFVPAGQLMAIRPRANGEAPEVLWESPKLRAATASPAVYQGRLYAVNSAGVLTCADPGSGEILWQERLKGPFSASPVAGDDKLYLVNEEGTTFVIDTKSDDRVIGTNPIGETILGSAAISGGRVYLRSDQHLYCIGAPPK
jgi:outer membrane protein assembly factor BamB